MEARGEDDDHDRRLLAAQTLCATGRNGASSLREEVIASETPWMRAGDEDAGEEEEEDEAEVGCKRKARPRRWTDAEDAALCEGVRKFGERTWKSIALAVGTRDHMQCLQRWKKVIKPGMLRGHWSAQEDDIIRRSVQGQDTVDWQGIANKLEVRSVRECKERWKYALSTLAAHRIHEEDDAASEQKEDDHQHHEAAISPKSASSRAADREIEDETGRQTLLTQTRNGTSSGRRVADPLSGASYHDSSSEESRYGCLPSKVVDDLRDPGSEPWRRAIQRRLDDATEVIKGAQAEIAHVRHLVECYAHRVPVMTDGYHPDHAAAMLPPPTNPRAMRPNDYASSRARLDTTYPLPPPRAPEYDQQQEPHSSHHLAMMGVFPAPYQQRHRVDAYDYSQQKLGDDRAYRYAGYR
ncbi:hypothetical protein CTAYLR_001989 [Chrysophaeum taylorii]|uniref:Uncharacterized protein n=1 Tax=Chrysophaeum taylorii TaxID=2483200 RepID=A0AAD7U8Q3_9STRA|nr:hypothetical protein CTAYLR_001989 [Chrysophaeum taylorii]